MSYSAKIICDSVSETGKRLTTFEITFPRIVLAEFNTHRMLSRNSASSRAIPFKKQIQRIVDNPFIPERFPVDRAGMQPNEYISSEHKMYSRILNKWLEARDAALSSAEGLYASMGIGDDWDYRYDDKPIIAIHKQIVNRLLEPFMWHTVIVTATEFDNFFKLRTNEQAQYEIRRIADLMYDEYHNSNQSIYNGSIKELKQGEWHLPFISEEDIALVHNKLNEWVERQDVNDLLYAEEQMLKQISVARCARVSYLTHDGKRDIEKDLELFEKLRTSGHYSPFEHIATPSFDIIDIDNPTNYRCHHEKLEWDENKTWVNRRNGNFIGWRQMRQDLPNENCEYFRKENQ